MGCFRYAAFGTLVAGSALAFGQSDGQLPPISPDRPSFSDGTLIVLKGHPQLEGGYTFSSAQGFHAETLGEFTYRLYLNPRAELRLLNVNFERDTGGAHGFQDPAIGIKWRVQDGVYTGAHRKLDLAAVFLTTVPSGSAGFRNDALQPTAKIVAQYSLSDATGVGANLLLSYLGEGSQRFTQYGASAFVQQNLDPKNSVYFEGYWLLPAARGGPDAGFANIGYGYLVKDNLILDLRVGQGFDRHRDGTFWGIGAAYRF